MDLTPYIDGWGSAGEAQVARLPSGTTLFVWIRHKTNCCYVVQARLATPSSSSPTGYALGAVKNLSSVGAAVGPGPTGVRVVAHGNGFLVAWTDDFESSRSIYARTVSSTGTLGYRSRVSGSLRSHRAQLDSMNGRAVIAWEACLQDNFGCWPQVQARAYGSSYGPLRVMSKPQSGVTSWFPDVAVDGDGDAVIAWHRLAGSTHTAQGAVLSAASVKGPIKDLSAPETTDTAVEGISVDVNAAGLGRVAWAKRTASGADVIDTRRFSTAGVTGPVQRLGTGFGSNYPHVAIGNGETATDASVIWFRNGSGTTSTDTSRILGRRIAQSGALSQTFRLSTTYPAEASFAVAPAPDGTGASAVLVVWHGATSTGKAVQSRTLHIDNTLSPWQIAAPGPGQYPAVASDPNTSGAALPFSTDAGGGESHVFATFGP